ncbi:MAG: hypothetical protein M3O02_02835 [Acidobacteriota bacterium]|nr:hypothetical protein [Acidobacteriota bacterium]
MARYRSMYAHGETRGGSPRVPHPGDVLYWIGCLSAVSALLFFATR